MTIQQQMQALKTELDRLTREQAESDGVTKQLYTQLKELGFLSVEEAIMGVRTLNYERIKLEQDRDKKINDYIASRENLRITPGTKQES